MLSKRGDPGRLESSQRRAAALYDSAHDADSISRALTSGNWENQGVLPERSYHGLDLGRGVFEKRSRMRERLFPPPCAATLFVRKRRA